MFSDDDDCCNPHHADDGEFEPACSQRPLLNDHKVDAMPMPATDEEKASEFRVLVASDIHTGYGERKKHIEHDSFNTFEEVLQLAGANDADFVLLGGDLFHENNPSRSCVTKVTSLLRRYCLSERCVQFEHVSDATVNFDHSAFDHVNYEDTNLNVGLPIYTIHGNHDDMSGHGLTALDPLHEAGLLNLFGKFTKSASLLVSPILLRKGNTRLAIYGIGSQRDDRLARAFQTGDVKFPVPHSEPESWFSILVLHQNRPRRSHLRTTGSYIPDHYIPGFFDLVIWGHEHYSITDPQYIAGRSADGSDGFYILQPGSTVATSLTFEESSQKHAFLLRIRQRQFQCIPLPLQTVRPMMVSELILDKMSCRREFKPAQKRPLDGQMSQPDEKLICDKIQLMIREVQEKRHERQPKLPLIRLKVKYVDEWADVQPPNARRIGMQFDGLVANPADMISIKRIGGKREAKGGEHQTTFTAKEARETMSLTEMILSGFNELPFDQKPSVMSDQFLNDVLKYCTEDDDDSLVAVRALNTAVEECVASQEKNAAMALSKAVNSRLEKQPDNYRSVQELEHEIESAFQKMKHDRYSKDN